MSISMTSARRLAASAVGATAVAGAMLFGALPDANAAPMPAPIPAWHHHDGGHHHHGHHGKHDRHDRHHHGKHDRHDRHHHGRHVGPRVGGGNGGLHKAIAVA
jgi:hypothetical protein